MSKLDYLVRLGGVFSILTLIHFIIDWVFQTHAEAMVKHNNALIRAKHCAIYTSPFLLLLWWLNVPLMNATICAAILFISHFIEDTYIPVVLWARYIRRVPSMQMDESPSDGIWTWKLQLALDLVKGKIDHRQYNEEINRRGFLEFIETTLGKILMIVIDQVIHIVFLIPVAIIILL